MSKGHLSDVSMAAMSRMNLRDMLVLPDTSTQMMSDLTRFYETDAASEGAKLEAATREALEAAYGFDRMDDNDRKPFVYQDGVAVVPIHGTLLNRCNWSWGFVTGFQYIRRMLNAALEDGDVETIVFDVDSPGGEAAGCFELAREIMASRRVKPSLAMVDSVAASGGIALAAAATKVYAIPSARVGSIGVYRMHVSYEGAHKQAGIKVTFAAAGEHKVDGNPYEDLPKAVLDEWRESAGRTWDDFIALIAETRDMSEEAVRDTQARIYRADEALAKGLINAVKTPTEAIGAFLAEMAEAEPLQAEDEDTTMADNKQKEVTSALTDADKGWIKELIGSALSAVTTSSQRRDAIRDHAAAYGGVANALVKSILDNEAISAEDGIAMLDAAFGKKAKKTKAAAPKGKQKASAVEDDEDDIEGEDDIDEDDEEEAGEGDDSEDEDDEDAEEAASTARKVRAKAKKRGDRTNHLARAMGNSKHPNAGGGRAKGGDESGGGNKAGNPLLADHARVTGADWSAKGAKPN